MTDLWKQVQSSYGDEINDRIEAEDKIIKMKESIIKLKIKYGNTHEEIKDFQTTHNGYENKHYWGVYVKLEDDLRETLFIKKVTFYLHESFVITDIVKKLPPYEYKCRGWGVFELPRVILLIKFSLLEFYFIYYYIKRPIHIEWQSWLNLETTVLNHYLSFDGDGSHKSFVITLNKELFLSKYPNSDTDIGVKSFLLKQKKKSIILNSLNFTKLW